MTVKHLILILLILLSDVTFGNSAKGAYGLYSFEDNSYAVAQNKHEVRSIASITKMFTAYTVVKSGVDLNEKVKVNGRSQGHVPSGVYISRLDLLRATIISSDNKAAETLANHHPGGYKKFLADVNHHIDAMSLYNTKIVDSTGLLAGNVSTVFDLIEFLQNIKDIPVIKEISNEKHHVISVPRGKKTVSVNLKNTNPDLFVYDNILISKTGFTHAAGRCVMMMVENGKNLFAVIVLGQSTSKSRSAVVSDLLNVDTYKAPAPKINSTVDYEKLVPL